MKKKICLGAFVAFVSILHILLSVKLLSLVDCSGAWGFVCTLTICSDFVIICVLAILLALTVSD